MLYNLHPLVHIVGFKPVHQQILQLTLESAVVKESKNYKQYKILSHDFYDGGAPSGATAADIYNQTGKADRLKMGTELGFLKYSFFKSLTMYKPAVSILVFDWQSQPPDNNGTYDWKVYEA